jgi:hypothetical protein
VKDQAEEDSEDKGLTDALMCLSMLVIMQDTSRIGTYHSSMMHYLAVRGIDEQTKGLRSAFLYTPILAGMLWINRLIMLEVAVPSKPWPGLRLKSKADIESVRDRIHQLREAHLCEGSFSPTSSILSQLAMGKSFNKTHQSPSNINWSKDEGTIHYLGQPVELKKIENMCHELIEELQKLMRILTFDSAVPTIDLSRIVDSMAWSQLFRQQNYSFISHVQNQDQVQGSYEYLLNRARRREGQWRLLQKNQTSQKMEWVDAQVQSYLTKERQFLRKLMVCMHITGESPQFHPQTHH